MRVVVQVPACIRSSRDGCTTKDLWVTVFMNFLPGYPSRANYRPLMTVKSEFAPEWRVRPPSEAS